MSNDEAIPRRVRAFYEDCSFPGYDDFDSPQQLAAKAERGIFARLLDQQIPLNARVLDAGCGTGQLTLFLSLPRRKVLGIDFSFASLSKGAAFGKRFALTTARFCQMDLLNLALKEESFDYVFCTGVLHHTADPRRGFDGLCRLIKRGGYIVIGLYNTYARLPLDARRLIFRLTGGRWTALDFIMRQKHVGAEKKRIWYLDQYRNPHEVKMSVDEVLAWFRENGIEYVNSVPQINRSLTFTEDEELFARREPGSRVDHVISQLRWMFTISREGGLFVIIGQRPASR
jgi:SAM-dependent methyltransferase